MMAGKEVLDTLLASEIRADLVTLFRKNPGLVDTIEGISRRIGLMPDAISDEVKELIKLGLLSTMKLGDREIIYFDRKKDKEIQEATANYLQTVKIRRKEVT